MARNTHTLQYGTYDSGEAVGFGIEPQLQEDEAGIVLAFVQRHCSSTSLAAHCRLAVETPHTSKPHTLLIVEKFEGRIDEVNNVIQAKLLTLGHIAMIDPAHHLIAPKLSLGLFFNPDSRS